MQDLVPAGQHGVARVEHITLSPEQAAVLAMESRDWRLQPGRYTRLFVRDELVMSDTLMELESNWPAVCRANGRVLVAGLGLGVILVPMLASPRVEHLTVVEREPDVIALVAPAFLTHLASGRLEIIEGDIFGWRPPRGARFDTIYFDIWPDISVANLPAIARLHRRFGRRLNRRNPDAWMGSWQHARLLDERRIGTRRW
jgi:predicted membrane-bound spermidine synthase